MVIYKSRGESPLSDPNLLEKKADPTQQGVYSLMFIKEGESRLFKKIKDMTTVFWVVYATNCGF